jgi:hypothetical protein
MYVVITLKALVISLKAEFAIFDGKLFSRFPWVDVTSGFSIAIFHSHGV